MDSSIAVQRALTALGKKTTYASPGKLPKFSASIFPADGRLDCSGFIYWCIRFPSSPPENRTVNHPFYAKINGGWFETTGIYQDGLAETGFFRRIEPAVGCFLVYPDYRGSDGKNHDGHIGIVTEIDASKSGLARVRKIIHCSLGGWKKQGDAIQETPPTHWIARSEAIAVWYEGFSDQPNFDASHTSSVAGLADFSPASAGNAAELDTASPKFRSLTKGGYFSATPYDTSIPRSIRTNNPGALNVTKWQRAFPGFIGTTAPDSKGNVTSIYVTPEHGIGAWHHLFTDRYGFGQNGEFTLPQLARRYAGIDDENHKVVKGYVNGWQNWSPGLSGLATLKLADDDNMLLLARGMFAHEAGKKSPLTDSQILNALALKRSGKLPDM